MTGATFIKPSPIAKLSVSHDVEYFDCKDPEDPRPGADALNDFLKKRALMNQNIGSATTYVTCRDQRVIGYYSLTTGCVTHDKASERMTKGMPKYDIPVVILARLAVHHEEKRMGIGRGLFKDALFRTAQIADIVGVRALMVDAKPEARDWYLKFDLEPGPIADNQLFLLMKDVKAALAGGNLLIA